MQEIEENFAKYSLHFQQSLPKCFSRCCVRQIFGVPLQKFSNKIVMSLLLDYTTGIGMPRPKLQHQMAMSQLHGNMFNELKSKGFEVLPEACLSQTNLNDLVPDLSIYNQQCTQLLAIIEITTHGSLMKDIRKCEELMARFPDIEYFVYDYETDLWYAYDQEADEWYNSEEYEIRSRYLDHPLPDYLI